MVAPVLQRKAHVMNPRKSKLATLVALGLAGCGETSSSNSTTQDVPVPCQGPGTVCTFAGNGVAAFDGDGRAATDTAFYWPMDLEFSPDGRPYILDWNNHKVRRIEPDGHVVTVMGTDLPGDGPLELLDGKPLDMTPGGAPGIDVELNHPTDLQFMPDGAMLLAAWHNHKIRRFDPATGRVTVVCGSGAGPAIAHEVATRATLNQPKSIAVDSKQNIFVADSRNQRIRVINGEGIIELVAGTGRRGFSEDGGKPLAADFDMQQDNNNPEPGGSITVDGEGRVYLADTYNNRIRRIDFAAGTVTTIAGNGTKGFAGDGGPATAASLNQPRDLELGPDQRLYIADTDNHRIRVLDLQTGIISTFAGNGQAAFTGDGGSALVASFSRPFGVAFDRDGNLYVADTFNHRIRKVVRP
jgi:DNA-binding beta-propeller fold protein YncE